MDTYTHNNYLGSTARTHSGCLKCTLNPSGDPNKALTPLATIHSQQSKHAVDADIYPVHKGLIARLSQHVDIRYASIRKKNASTKQLPTP